MKYSTVIFDMDGTLLNTIEDITDSVNYIMNEYGFPLRTIDEVRHFVGSGAAKLIERVVPDGRENPLFDKVLKDYEAYYLGHCDIKTGLYKHIPELMAELKKMGVKMAIVSNKPMDAVLELKEQYFKEYAEAAIGVADGLRRKPYPDECLEAMKRLGVSKEECVYVGDSEVDHQTALNTGISCISCLWGFRTKEELIKAGASENVFVSDPLEIVDCIK